MKKECPAGTIRNPRTGRCIKECPPGSIRDPKTGRCKADKEALRLELDAIVRQLKKPRLAETAFFGDDCLKSISTERLEQEIERRKRINVLIPRKKG